MRVFALLDDFIDRELSLEEMQRVQAHLERCATCAAEDRRERAWIGDVRLKLQRVDLPPDVLHRITRRLGTAAREPLTPPAH